MTNHSQSSHCRSVYKVAAAKAVFFCYSGVNLLSHNVKFMNTIKRVINLKLFVGNLIYFTVFNPMDERGILPQTVSWSKKVLF